MVGLSLPPGWRLEPLGDLGRLLSGGTPTTSNEAYWGGDIPWVSAKDMKRARLSDAIDHVTSLAIGRGTRLAPKHALLLVVRGMSLARSFPVARAEVALAFNQDLKALVPRVDVDSDFLLWWLTAHESLFMGITTESTHGTKRLPTGAIRGVEVALPLEAEQRAIATALSDVDALLGALDRLIAKKRDLKQAAMQQLLTGQMRLPGFNGEWKLVSLGDICTLKSGAGITSAQLDQHSQYPCYGGNGMRGFASAFTHNGDYALIGRQGALCGNVVRVSGRFFASEHAIVVTPALNVDIDWLTVVLVRMNLNRYSESSAQPGLAVDKLLLLEVNCPQDVKEQSAIATVLTDMDAEVEALEDRRAKTSDIKQAMMQELLTGRTRLV